MRRKKKRNSLIKAILAIMLIFVFVLTGIVVIMVQGPAEKEWTAGIEDGANSPIAEQQGGNGWYFLYSDVTGSKGKVDVSKLKECPWGTKGSCWFYYGVTGMWLTDEYAADGYDPDKNGNWWLMDTEGHMSISAKNAYTAAVAWEAQLNGLYTIEVEYEGGSNSYEWEGKTYYLTEKDGGDGLYVSLNNGNKPIEKKFCKAVTKKEPDLTKGTMEATVELKKGDRIYLCEDPGKASGGDTLNYNMKITLDKAGFNLSFNGTVGMVLGAVLAMLIGFIYSFVNKRQN